MTEPAIDPIAAIRAHSAALAPQPTGLEPRLQRLPDIRAVLFDVYGTLVISASGDISLASSLSRGDACAAAIEAIGLRCSNGDATTALLVACIRREQQRIAADGRLQAEVEIRDCWRHCLTAAAEQGLVDRPCHDPAAIELVAVEYECRTNPVWEMPHAASTLRWLRDAGSTLGIVSNAQFYTPLLFPALLDDDLGGFGFEAGLCWFSFAHGYGKPDPWLYRQAVEALAERGLAAEQCLYVGNDQRNDVWPAAVCGMKTALFAGDARSLRLRQDHPEASAVMPDLIITDLAQIPDCVAS